MLNSNRTALSFRFVVRMKEFLVVGSSRLVGPSSTLVDMQF